MNLPGAVGKFWRDRLKKNPLHALEINILINISSNVNIQFSNLLYYTHTDWSRAHRIYFKISQKTQHFMNTLYIMYICILCSSLFSGYYKKVRLHILRDIYFRFELKLLFLVLAKTEQCRPLTTFLQSDASSFLISSFKFCSSLLKDNGTPFKYGCTDLQTK